MRRVIALTAVLALGLTALADIGPPPGIKRIPYEARILVSKDVTGYLFFAVSGGDKATPVKADEKTAGSVKAGGGRYRSAELVAVPADAEKKFGSEKEFHAAIAKGKVDGLVKAKRTFNAFNDVKEADTRKSIVEEFTITKVDEKGITLEAAKPAKGDSPKNAPDESEPAEDLPSSAMRPQGGWIVAGIAAFFALALAGLRLVGYFTRRAH